MILYKNCLGDWYFDKDIELVEKPSQSGKDSAKPPTDEELSKILAFFKPKASEFFQPNLLITKKKVADSVCEDHLIIQAISCIDETTTCINRLAKRLREWYELYNPEFSRSIHDHSKFAELIQSKSKDELLKEINLKKEESMGADLEEKDIEPIMVLAKEINLLFKFKDQQDKYLESVMKQYCPNLTALAGASIGATMLRIAGSLKKLAEFPASTVQLLGAEKALFRHLRTGARSPKYGIVLNHPFVSDAPNDKKAKIARSLASKISIAVKVDLFKGEFMGDKLRKEVSR